jgi:hypothetical protein
MRFTILLCYFFSSIAEIILYHGTDSNNVGLIFTENFRLDLTPLNRPKGSAHGKGIYFSLDLRTAMSYGYSGVVIACRVLIGKIGVNADTKCVGNVYVVQSPDQILPFCVLNLKAKQEKFHVPPLIKYISQSKGLSILRINFSLPSSYSFAIFIFMNLY